MNAIAIIVVISLVTPFFLCGLIPLCWIYYNMQQVQTSCLMSPSPLTPFPFVLFFSSKLFVRSSRELKRLDGTSRSPINAHFIESLAGVSVIRAFDKTDQFVSTNEQKLDLNQRVSIVISLSLSLSLSSNRLTIILIDSICVLGCE